MWMHVQSLEWSQWEEYGAERPRLLSISLPQFLRKETADPRDKLFALRALFPDIIGDITVDYDRAVEDIFTEATIRLLGASRSLETLYTACVCKKSYSIPSWAVDWAHESELHQISDGAFREEEDWYSIAFAFGDPRTYDGEWAWFGDDRLLLKLLGKSFSQVSTCVSDKVGFHTYWRGAGVSFMNLFQRFLTAAASTEFLSRYNLGSDVANVLRSAQVSNAIPHNDLLRMEVENDVDMICGLMRDHSRTLALILRRKRFFLTGNGRVALGNRNLLPGDLLVCFYGLAMPFIVRPKGPHYILISPAIVDRATLGEMWPQDHDEMVQWEIA